MARWQELFAAAWPLIESDYPAYAAGLRAGLSTIMPLSASDEPGATSAPPPGRPSARSGVARPDDGETLALLLIHEFQHVKLGAMLDLVELCDPLPTGGCSTPRGATTRARSRPCCRAPTRTWG